MADEPAVPQETEDTPLPEGTDPQQGTPEQDGTNWEERYKNLEADHTRAAQEAAQLRVYQEAVQGLKSEDPETRQWALDALGLEAAEEEEAYQEADPNQELLQRISDMEQHLNQSQEQAQQADLQNQEVEYMNTELTAASEKLGRQFTEQELHFIVPNAVANRDENGWPGITTALDNWAELMQSQADQGQSQWAASKKSSTPASGQEGVEAPNLDNEGDRVAWMVSQAQANS
jgi:hypothetical protein